MSQSSKRGVLLIATLILLLGAGLRQTLLISEPAGLSAEELTNAQISQGVRQGDFSVVYTSVTPAREGVFHALLAVFTTFVGEGVLLWRLPSVWASMLAIAMVYRLTLYMTNQRTALLAMGVMAVAAWPVMLGRVATHASLMPFISALVLYLLLRGFNAEDYQDAAPWFTAGAFILGIAQYVHYSAWSLVIVALGYAIYRWSVHGQIIPFQLESLIYASFLTLVLLIPLLLFLLGSPQARLPVEDGFAAMLLNLPAKYLQSFTSIFLIGSTSPLYGVPGRAALNVMLAALFLIGLGAVLTRWQRTSVYVSVLLLFAGLIPAGLAPEGADLSYMAVIIPAVMVLVAQAAEEIATWVKRSMPACHTPISAATIFVTITLSIFTIFVQWGNLPQVQRAYQMEVGQIAHFLDTQQDELPVSLCSLPVDRTEDPFALTNAQLLDLLMHRQRTDIRVFDCTQSIVLAEGGTTQYFVFLRGHYYDFIPGALLSWMANGESIDLEHVEPDVIVRVEAQEQLADEVGAFITTALTLWPPEEGSREFAELPVEFEGNVTFLGYEVRDPTLQSTELLEIVTYWRLDGPPPPQVTMFVHLLNNPVVVLAQEDTIGVETASLQSRDVFVQYNRVRLPASIEPGTYPVSVGMFFTDSGERLTALQDGEPRANRLFLQRVEFVE